MANGLKGCNSVFFWYAACKKQRTKREEKEKGKDKEEKKIYFYVFGQLHFWAALHQKATPGKLSNKGLLSMIIEYQHSQHCYNAHGKSLEKPHSFL